MRIGAIELRAEDVPLTRPYAVATYATSSVRMVRAVVTDVDGTTGCGAATPEPEVNGETAQQCVDALHAAIPGLLQRDWQQPRELEPVLRHLLPDTPGARAALDIALHDLWGRRLRRPVADLLGRVHTSLPTSVTIGVGNVDDTLQQAREHLARGFRVLKVKIGADLEQDVARLVRLRAAVGAALPLLVDANVGYTFAQLGEFLRRTRELDLRLVEQPLPPAASSAQAALPASEVARLVADESLHDADDATRLVAPPRPFGVFNIKLMKCGGIVPALRIADVAERAGLSLMWGCMDESVVGIAAALHAAFACRATRWLDLDGSFDLAADFASGGFELVDGCLRTLDAPGLGVEPAA